MEEKTTEVGLINKRRRRKKLLKEPSVDVVAGRCTESIAKA
jgi:hypothetical protein